MKGSQFSLFANYYLGDEMKRRVEHVACIPEKRNETRILRGKPK
jgi:hypothetical protein